MTNESPYKQSSAYTHKHKLTQMHSHSSANIKCLTCALYKSHTCVHTATYIDLVHVYTQIRPQHGDHTCVHTHRQVYLCVFCTHTSMLCNYWQCVFVHFLTFLRLYLFIYTYMHTWVSTCVVRAWIITK